MDSIFRICKGRSTKLDLSSYQTKSKSYTSFLTMSWAMIADIDIESECIRFLGALRNDIWGVWRVINLRSYRARFSYLPIDTENTTNQNKELPDILGDVPTNWITIEDDFILFWASQVTHASYNVLQSPKSKLQDGIFRVWIVR